MDKNDLLKLAAHEAETRAIRYSPIEILSYKASEQIKVPLCPSGTITTFLARKGSGAIDKLRSIAFSHDRQDEQLAQQITQQYRSRQKLSYFDAWEMLHRQPVFATLRYGARTLATNYFVPPGIEYAVGVMPYNGGLLNPKELTLVEHYKDTSEVAFEALALVNEPSLTDAERSALERVPTSQSELNLAPDAGCCDDVTGMIILVLMTAVMVRETMAETELRLSDDVIARLGPAATARQLLEMRRDVLGHVHQE